MAKQRVTSQQQASDGGNVITANNFVMPLFESQAPEVTLLRLTFKDSSNIKIEIEPALGVNTKLETQRALEQTGLTYVGSH